MNDELTEVDIKKMREEIDHRKSELTPTLMAALVHARELGDLSENEEYKNAKRELNRNYSRIRYLEAMIKTAKVIDVAKADDETVALFDKLTVYYENLGKEKEIKIVTTLRNDVTKGLISKESPVGQALLGKKLGDRVLITVSDTVSYYVVIRKIEKGEDDESLEISHF